MLRNFFAVSILLQNMTFVFTLAVGLPIPWPQLSVLWPWAAPPRPDRWPGHHRLRWGHHEAQCRHQVCHYHSRRSQGRRSVRLSTGLSSCSTELCVWITFWHWYWSDDWSCRRLRFYINCFGTVNVQFNKMKRKVFYIHVDVSFNHTFHVHTRNSSLGISDLSTASNCIDIHRCSFIQNEHSGSLQMHRILLTVSFCNNKTEPVIAYDCVFTRQSSNWRRCG